MKKSFVLAFGLALLLNACGGGRVIPEPLPGPQLVLDDAFGTNGQVRTSLERYSESYAATLQQGGKVVAVGTTREAEGNTLFGLVRYLPDGTLDASFGDGGKVVTDVQPPGTSNRLAIPYAAASQGDGKIVVAGFREASDALYDPQLVVIRYTSAGELDSSFGEGGFFSFETPGSSVAYDAVVQPDGKLVVVGRLGDATLLLRLTPEGSLDSTFGTGGFVTSPAASPRNGEPSVALTESGQVLIAAGDSLTRYTAEGELDASFERPDDTYYGPISMALQADGRIVVGTTRERVYGALLTPQTSPVPQTEIVVRRFFEDGTVDTTFGQGGAAVVGEDGSRALSDLSVQPDGKVIVTGDNALVARLSETGTLEASAVGAFESAQTVLVTQENAVIIVGFTRSPDGRDFALAKFLP